MSKIFERVVSISHEAFDVLHNVVIGYSTAAVWVWLAKFLHFDYDFLFWCAFFLGLDTFTGFYKHWRKKTHGPEGFSRFFDKLVIVISTYLLLHGLQNAEIGASLGELWFITGAHFTLYAWLAWSSFTNISAISNGRFPPQSWIDALGKVFYRRGQKPSKPDDGDDIIY